MENNYLSKCTDQTVSAFKGQREQWNQKVLFIMKQSVRYLFLSAFLTNFER